MPDSKQAKAETAEAKVTHKPIPEPKVEKPVQCGQCGETNNWREINIGAASKVYNCRCGGRIEVLG